MTTPTSLNEAALAQECLHRIGDETSVLRRVEDVLEMIANSSAGLGEVLQDFAQQTLGQLRDLTAAARHIASGVGTANDREMLSKAYFILNTARLVLERTPVAMQRNMAETLGAARLSRAEVQKTAHAFQQSPDIAHLLASEDSGYKLAMLNGPDGDLISPDKASVFLESVQH